MRIEAPIPIPIPIPTEVQQAKAIWRLCFTVVHQDTNGLGRNPHTFQPNKVNFIQTIRYNPPCMPPCSKLHILADPQTELFVETWPLTWAKGISRSEQAPRSGFHPFFGVKKVFVDLWDFLSAI